MVFRAASLVLVCLAALACAPEGEAPQPAPLALLASFLVTQLGGLGFVALTVPRDPSMAGASLR